MDQETLELAQQLINHPRWSHQYGMSESYLSPDEPQGRRMICFYDPLSPAEQLTWIRGRGLVPNLACPVIWGWLIAWILAEGGAVELRAGQHNKDHEHGALLARQLLELWGKDQ